LKTAAEVLAAARVLEVRGLRLLAQRRLSPASAKLRESRKPRAFPARPDLQISNAKPSHVRWAESEGGIEVGRFSTSKPVIFGGHVFAHDSSPVPVDKRGCYQLPMEIGTPGEFSVRNGCGNFTTAADATLGFLFQ